MNLQILTEWTTTVLEVKVEMGCLNGNLEHNKATKEVDSMDAASKTVHSKLMTLLINQYSKTLMLAAK